jgi:hypothetical protein
MRNFITVMAGTAMTIGVILLVILLIGLVALLFYLLYFAIIYRHKPLKAVLAGILFACIAAFTLFLFLRRRNANPKYLGDYKLNWLDRHKCNNCKVRLKENYTYDIIVNNQVVGEGKWHTGTAIDIPGNYLIIEHGPREIIWEWNRMIDFIDRSGN